MRLSVHFWAVAPLLEAWTPRSTMTKRGSAARNAPKYCADCGSQKMAWRVPPGDERERFLCGDCGYVHYVNPKVVCGCVVRAGRSVLLGRRAIEPRRGAWGFPQGFMELGENSRECAARECREETGFVVADIAALRLLSVYNLPNQLQVVYQLDVDAVSHAGSTKESSEVRLFDYDEIPWDELAFPTVEWALRFVEGRSSPGHVQERTKCYDGDRWLVVEESAMSSY